MSLNSAASSESTTGSSSESDSHPSPAKAIFSSTQRSHKRKALGDSAGSQPHSKRLKASHNEKYRKLFNETLESVCHEELLDVPVNLAPTNIGGTLWKVDEKLRLFNALALQGRSEYGKVAAKVETKSEPEVRHYVRNLALSATEHDLYSRKKESLFDHSVVEPALDVGQACEAALESAADALSMLQYQEEARAERDKYPEHWLLNQHASKWIDDCLDSDHQGKQMLSIEMPFAHLLHVKNFLNLSKQIFMNSQDPVYNWRSYKHLENSSSKSPSIMFSACSDFHTIVCECMRRLIRISLFLAQSRLKATQGHLSPKKQVRQADVLAAVEMAGLPLNADKYWRTLSHRCNIRVSEHPDNDRGRRRKQSSEETEESLKALDSSRSRSRRRSSPRPFLSADEKGNASGSDTVSDNVSPDESELTSSGSDFDGSDDDLDTDDAKSYESPSTRHPGISSKSKQQKQEALRDAYLEACDLRADRAEEKRLWEELGQNDAEQLGLESGEMAKKPAPPNKRREGFTDWLDWTEHAAEWEAYPTFSENEAFETRSKLNTQGKSSDISFQMKTEGDKGRGNKNESLPSGENDDQVETSTDYVDYDSSEEYDD